jgi:long-subunit fatty acid transport protein
VNKRVLLKRSVLALGFILLSAPSFASSPGTTSAVELELPVGPRAIGMGEAYGAVADDALAIYWNPAGLRQLGGVHITAQYTDFIDTIKYNYIAIGMPFQKKYALGLGLKTVSSGTADEVNEIGQLTGGTIGLSYMELDGALAYKLGYNFDIGLTVKYLSETLKSSESKSAATVAADIGVNYRFPVKNLSGAVVLQNLGTGLKYGPEAEKLPFNLKLGTAYKMFDNNFTAAFDINVPNDNKPVASIGGEYWYHDRLAGRMGYRYQGGLDWNGNDAGGMGGLFLGVGLKVSVGKSFWGLDYAWSTQGFLGTVHRIALNAYL